MVYHLNLLVWLGYNNIFIVVLFVLRSWQEQYVRWCGNYSNATLQSGFDFFSWFYFIYIASLYLYWILSCIYYCYYCFWIIKYASNIYWSSTLYIISKIQNILTVTVIVIMFNIIFILYYTFQWIEVCMICWCVVIISITT